jgi:hypothetical protein
MFHAIQRAEINNATLGLLQKLAVIFEALKAGDTPAFDEALLAVIPKDMVAQPQPLRNLQQGQEAEAVLDPLCPGYDCRGSTLVNPSPLGSTFQEALQAMLHCPGCDFSGLTLPGGTPTGAGHENTAQALVLSQSTAHNCQNEGRFIREWTRIADKYTALGSGFPAYMFALSYGLGYFFPNPTPLAPAGRPMQEGLVVGHLWDFATPYRWSQEMAQAFPSASFLSTQMMWHGVGENPNPNAVARGGEEVEQHGGCFHYIANYLADGILPPTGAVCLTPDQFATLGQFEKTEASLD